jgi:hypothetical protein
MELKDCIGRRIGITLMKRNRSREFVTEGTIIRSMGYHYLKMEGRNLGWCGSNPNGVRSVDTIRDNISYWSLDSMKDTATRKYWYKDIRLLGIQPKKHIRKHTVQ